MMKSPLNTSIEETQKSATKRRVSGEFVRGVSGFRHAIGDPDFQPEKNRYHLFVAFNCPWCHCASLARNIRGLQSSITMDVVFPSRTETNDRAGPNLWQFAPERVAIATGGPLPECTSETATEKSYSLIKEIYAAEGSTEQSVPILYDKKAKRIVNNESAEIIRMLDSNANALGTTVRQQPYLYPKDETQQNEVNILNKKIYTTINNGAYKAGFSSDQKIYAKAFCEYFQTLSELEEKLAADDRPFLTGANFTEADLRLFPTLYRHDPIYYLRMKLNGAKILDYPHLWRWLCRVYALPGVAESSALTHCKQGYFGRTWNKTIPVGPLKPMPYPSAYHHPELSTERLVLK